MATKNPSPQSGSDIVAQAQADVNGSMAGGPIGGVGVYNALTPDQIISSLLGAAAQEVQPTSGFVYGQDALPDWFPKELLPAVAGGTFTINGKTGTLPPNSLQGIYDPYMGNLSQSGDEQTYMGAGPDRPVWVQDMHYWTGEEKARKRQKQQQDVATSEYVLHNKATVGNDTENPEFTSAAHHDANQAHFAPPPGTPKTEPTDKTITTAQAVNLPYTWSDEKVREAMKKMRQAGLPVTNFNQLVSTWGSLVDRASKMYDLSQGQNKVTPWDVLELSKRESQSAGSYINYENGSHTTTSRSVSDITQGDSWKALRTTLSTLLGRDPTSQELRDYTYRMNQLAAQNPTITTKTTDYRGGHAVSAEQHTTGGFDGNDMAEAAYKDAQDNPDYGAYQSATTYFNAAVSALGAIGG